MTHPTAEHDTTYATVAYVALEGRRQDDLRKAEATRVNDLQAAQMRHTDALVSGLRETLTTISRDILAGQARADTTATNLAAGVKELAGSVAEGVDRSNETINERFKPLEAAMNTTGGRTPVIEKVLFAVMGSALAILGAIVGRLAIGT